MSAREIRGSQTDKPTLESRGGRANCRVDIRIETPGPVNIYNCTSEPPCPEQSTPKCPTGRVAPGQCVPLSIGSKPKQSLRTKLNSLLQNTRAPSAIAGGFLQHARRFAAGQSAANTLETEIFSFFQALPANMKSILACSVTSFDGITQDERNRLFDPSIPQDPSVPLDADTLAIACVKEITQRVAVQLMEDALGFTLGDLHALTNTDLPFSEIAAQYVWQQGIKVKTFPLERARRSTAERREYRSDEEESRYEIVLRYNRVA